MGSFGEKHWYKRMAIRNDQVIALAHLTKPEKFKLLSILMKNKQTTFEQLINDINCSSVENLIKILKDGVIKGSGKSGFIIGSNTATCFQEVPSRDILANIEYEYEQLRKKYDTDLSGFNLRYTGVGIYFDKRLIYRAGGRPVIYDDTSNSVKMVSPDEHWRLVDLNLENTNITDWTHEREWRIKGDYQFSLEQVFQESISSLIFPNRTSYNYFYKLIQNEFDQDWVKLLNVNDLQAYVPNVIILDEYTQIQLESRLSNINENNLTAF